MHFLDIIKGHCKKVCNKNYQPIIDSLELIVIKVNSCYNVVVAGTQVGWLWPALNAEVMAGRVWGICFYFYGNISHIWVNPCNRLLTLGLLTKASRVRPAFTTILLMFSLPPFCASVITRVFTQKRLSALGCYILPYILEYSILSFLSSIPEFYFLQMLEVDFMIEVIKAIVVHYWYLCSCYLERTRQKVQIEMKQVGTPNLIYYALFSNYHTN